MYLGHRTGDIFVPVVTFISIFVYLPLYIYLNLFNIQAVEITFM